MLSKAEALIEQRTKDMDRLKQQLLANPSQDVVKEELVQWKKRSQFLDDEIIRLQKEEKQFLTESKEAENRREECHHESQGAKDSYHKVTYQLEEVSKAQESSHGIFLEGKCEKCDQEMIRFIEDF